MGYVPSRILNKVKPFFKSVEKVPLEEANQALKEYRALAVAASKRHAARKAAMTLPDGGRAFVAYSPEYNRLVKEHAKQYGKELVDDVTHPVKTVKRQIEMVKNKITPEGEIIKHSPAASALTAATLFGLPLIFGAQELNNKNPSVSTQEKYVRAGAQIIPPMMTPKVIPSYIAYAVPDAIYRSKDKRKKKKGIRGAIDNSKFSREYAQLMEYLGMDA